MVAVEVLLDALGRGEEVVDRGGVEDPVGERAVVGGAVAVAGEDGVDLGVGKGPVQVVDGLGGGLTRTDDDEAAVTAVRRLRSAEEQVAGVPHVLALGHPVGEAGRETGADRDVERPQHLPVGRVRHALGHDLDRLDPVPAAHGPYLDDAPPVVDGAGERRGTPLEVVVELDPCGEEGLLVDEVGQSAPLLQVHQKGEATAGVPHADEILEEGDLHGGPFQQHSPVPAEALLLLHEPRPERPFGIAAIVVGDRDGQSEVGRAEPYSDQVLGGAARGLTTVLAASRHAGPSVGSRTDRHTRAAPRPRRATKVRRA
ncbi:hypothetical protein GCM10010272_15240 [Streptomyces lateritius]|nr:hypothetical protein GCM10010272_15240 [Streptomyces lateritius]